jgi:hypothetical protein
MEIVEKFIKSERMNLSWLDKFANYYPEFFFAKDFKLTEKDYLKAKPQITIRPAIIRRIIALLLISVGLYSWLILFVLVLQKTLFPITLAFLLLLSLWIGLILRWFFLSPKCIFKIKIDSEGLSIKNLTLTWETILETIVMVKGTGRSKISNLVIFTTDNEIHKYSLNNLSIYDERILRFIELYRTKKTNAQQSV